MLISYMIISLFIVLKKRTTTMCVIDYSITSL